MIGFELNGTKYKFYFSYERKDVKANKKSKDAVFCHFENSDTKEIIFSSVAYCSPEDNFSKEVGRQISFVRCVHNLYYLLFLYFNETDKVVFKDKIVDMLLEYYGKNENEIRKIELPLNESIMLNKLLLFKNLK